MLTEETKNQLKPLVTEVGRDSLQPRLVLVYCVNNKSGVRAAKIIKAATGRSVTNTSGIGPAPIFYRSFAFRFATRDDADEFTNDLTQAISEAVDEGTFGKGYDGPASDDGSAFFHSTMFYALISIAVVILLAAGALAYVRKKK